VVTAYKAADGMVVGTVKTADTSAAFTGLTNGTGYTVEVAAENSAGVGPASARSAIITPSTVPAKVTGVVVKRGAASLAVTWKAPADGGSPLTGYRVTVYVAKGGKIAATPTLPAKLRATTVKGLKNGTGYTVDVRAISATGTGSPSARSAVVTPATKPGRPIIRGTKTGKRGGRSTALVAWRAPSSNGGSAITSYRITAVKYSAHGRVLSRTTIVLRSGKVRSAELRLAAGTYRFTVQAVNAVGVGAASAPSKPTAAR
jgi:predicted phage tail protein